MVAKKSVLVALSIASLMVASLLLSGCSDKEVSTTMTAYTSVYPVEYILDNLYGSKIAIYSIYPDGINYKNYKLTWNLS